MTVLVRRRKVMVRYGHADGRATGLVIAEVGNAQVTRHSKVAVSITELAQPPGQPLDYPFIGDARMTIENVAPLDNGIIFVRLTINWSSDLPFRLSFLIAP